MSPLVCTHGGAGAAPALIDGPQRAAERGLEALRNGADALEAVIAATVDLEDDPRFNAGTGSNLRLDGETIEMDAAVMTSDGLSGAVANLRGVRNPVRVAAAVRARTPHLLLAGDGALAFARRLGFEPWDPTTDRARRRLLDARRGLRGERRDDGELVRWRDRDVRALWNFDLPCTLDDPEHDPRLGDTVGAVARDADGRYAAASSTGGTLVMLRGRIGDSPLIGCGLYAGPHGAVTATGVGEEIVRRFLSLRVYEALAAGVPVEEACRRGVALFPDDVAVGVIAVAADGGAAASNRPMPVGRT
jgi:isoaspartyl peptidase/L-asparaginase-like protein (Ntn-hydrolase superfamily)